MDRDEILTRSRKENEGQRDERELAAHGHASRVGMLVGALVCVALVLASELLFHVPEIGWVGWLVYFTMQGAGNIVLYQDLRNARSLVWGLVELVFAVLFAVTLVLKSMV